MKLGHPERRRSGIKAGALLREPELAPAFDLRKELPEEFLDNWRREVRDTFIRGEVRQGSRGIAAAVQLREQLGAVAVLNQVFGADLLPLDASDQRLAERKMKVGLRDLSRLTQKLTEGKFRWWDAIEELGDYHGASRVKRPQLLGDDAMQFIESNMPNPNAGLDTLLAILRLRPDKRALVRDWGARFDRRVEEAYKTRTHPTVAPPFLKMLNEYLLIYPEKRDQFPLSSTDRQLAHQEAQARLKKERALLMPLLKQQGIAFAQEAWVDEEGKVQVRMPASQVTQSPELPERPQV